MDIVLTRSVQVAVYVADQIGDRDIGHVVRAVGPRRQPRSGIVHNLENVAGRRRRVRVEATVRDPGVVPIRRIDIDARNDRYSVE